MTEKIVVDGLPAFKTFIGSVPETDAVLSEFPAKAHFAALIKRQKIDEADVQVLDQGAGFFDLFERIFERDVAVVAAGTKSENRSAIDVGAAGDANAGQGLFEFLMRFLIFGLVEDSFAEGPLDLRQKTFTGGEREIF